MELFPDDYTNLRLILICGLIAAAFLELFFYIETKDRDDPSLSQTAILADTLAKQVDRLEDYPLPDEARGIPVAGTPVYITFKTPVLVNWNGKVTAQGTYNRLQVTKIPPDNTLPYFWLEFPDDLDSTQWRWNSPITITGTLNGLDCQKYKESRTCVPWVELEKIEAMK